MGSLSSELSDDHPWARDALAANRTVWSEAIRAGLAAMVDDGVLRRETDATALSLALAAALQGGLVLAQAQRATDALEAALDAVITHIHDHAAPSASTCGSALNN